MKKSRGMRNNNPLCVKKQKASFIGKASVQFDTQLVTFKSMAYGYRMAWKYLESIRVKLAAKDFRFNVGNVIYAWFPSYDGYDTEGIIERVTRMTDLNRMENLPLPEQTSKRNAILLKALTAVLNDMEYEKVEMKEIEEGYRLATSPLTF